MKAHLRWILFGTAFAGMGFSMPSCPGQKETKQQIETLQVTNDALSKKVQALSAQVSSLTNDMNQVKQVLPQITNVIQAQKGALEQLNVTVSEMRAKASKGSSSKKKHR